MNLNAPAFRQLAEVLVFTLLAIALLQQIYDWDIWYHLSIGREIAQSLSIPSREFLVYPNINQPGEYHEWGFGLLFFFTYELAGYWGMSILNAIIACLILWLLFRAVDKDPWSSPVYLLVLMAVLAWLQSRFIYRPEMVLYLALAFEILLLERFCRDRSWKWLAPIPLLGLALSQIHPSVILMLVILGAYTLQIAWAYRKQLNFLFKYMGWFFLCGLLTAVFSLFNPYGLDQLLLPLTFSQQEAVTQDIFEFKPSLDSVAKWRFIILTVCALVALLVQRKKRVVDYVLYLLFAYLAYRYARNIALFALVMYVPMARGFSDLLQTGSRFFKSRRTKFSIRHLERFSWGVTTAVFVYVLITTFSSQTGGVGPLAGQYPVKSVEVINKIQPPGRIFNSYEMGGYLGWVLKGRYQVFIDGRHYRMNRALAAYRSIRGTRIGWQKALAFYDINTIIIPPKLIAGKLMPLLAALAEDTSWILVVAQDREMMFLRTGASIAVPETLPLDRTRLWSMIVDEAKWTIEVFPGNHLAHVTLAGALMRLGERDQAIDALHDYLVLEPGDTEIARRLAKLEMEG